MSIDPNVKIRELDGYWYRKNAYEEVLKLDSIEDVDIVFAHMIVGIPALYASTATGVTGLGLIRRYNQQIHLFLDKTFYLADLSIIILTSIHYDQLDLRMI